MVHAIQAGGRVTYTRVEDFRLYDTKYVVIGKHIGPTTFSPFVGLSRHGDGSIVVVRQDGLGQSCKALVSIMLRSLMPENDA